jgi:hypothetical protein
MKSGWGKDFGVSTFEKEETVDQYDANNGFGARTTVAVMSRHSIGVFENRQQVPSINSLPEEWESDTYVTKWSDLAGSNIDYPAVTVSITPAEARTLKDEMRVGIVFSPLPPFAVSGSITEEPTYQYPVRVNWDVDLMFGDISCAVLTDADGVVKKTIRMLN